MAYVDAGTSSSYYKVGMDVSYTNNDTDHEYTDVTIQPYLIRLSSNEKRYQHVWTIHFAIDNVVAHTEYYTKSGGSMHDLLPNDNTYPGVVGAGHLNMKAGTKYKWGTAQTIQVPNDGATHTVGIRMKCTGTSPNYCPSETGWLTYTIPSKTYKVYNPKNPKNLKAEYNADTGKLIITWDPVENSKYLRLYINRHTTPYYSDDPNTLAPSGYVTPDLDSTATYYEELITDERVKFISCELVNYGANGARNPDMITASCEIGRNNKVWIKTPSGWKKAIPWVKVDGQWKKANKVYVKTANGWKRTIM